MIMAIDTDMSTFMGLSQNKDLKNGLIRAESVHGIIYDIFYVIMIMNTDYAQIVP